MSPPLHQQVVCWLCGSRHQTLVHRDDPQIGDRTRAECVDCGFETVQEVTFLYDPDLYSPEDPHGDGGAHQYTDQNIPPIPSQWEKGST